MLKLFKYDLLVVVTSLPGTLQILNGAKKH